MKQHNTAYLRKKHFQHHDCWGGCRQVLRALRHFNFSPFLFQVESGSPWILITQEPTPTPCPCGCTQMNGYDGSRHPEPGCWPYHYCCVASGKSSTSLGLVYKMGIIPPVLQGWCENIKGHWWGFGTSINAAALASPVKTSRCSQVGVDKTY